MQDTKDAIMVWLAYDTGAIELHQYHEPAIMTFTDKVCGEEEGGMKSRRYTWPPSIYADRVDMYIKVCGCIGSSWWP